MSYEVKGTVIRLQPPEQVGNTEYLKSLCVIETDGDYPKQIPLTGFGKQSGIFDELNEGDQASVMFSVSGREGKNGQWYSSNNAYKVVKRSGSSSPPPKREEPPVQDDEDSGIPF